MQLNQTIKVVTLSCILQHLTLVSTKAKNIQIVYSFLKLAQVIMIAQYSIHSLCCHKSIDHSYIMLQIIIWFVNLKIYCCKRLNTHIEFLTLLSSLGIMSFAML